MKNCCVKSLYFLPILCTVWIFISLGIAYVIALRFGHINTFVPYISGIAKYFPEVIFTEVAFTITSCLDAVIYYSEFKYRKIYHPKSSGACNIIMLFLGILACFGMLLATHVSSLISSRIHLVGAFLGFGVGAVYNICHTIQYCKSASWWDHYYMTRIRITVITTVPIVTFGVFKQMDCTLLKTCNQNDMYLCLIYPENIKDDWICKSEEISVNDEEELTV
ncbi:DNA damage-regulated autophagy modulator protein 1 isoform X2 [Xenopus laevis]|uniref:DNA damage-regulated autophagy modulator protein 1 isoform X2 n=1 Tax=Xenopus laevis TaxID=8355 RepID=A0A8J1L4W0_XENLA|nr:DNA damage-regulated autophagy modulator protein 1 isoform X2 [Xenopus laevis]